MADVRLVIRRYMWNYELDDSGAPVPAGEAVMRPVETFAVYATPQEALLQAAHNELLEHGLDQEIFRGDESLIRKSAIKEASKMLREHRLSAGHESPILDKGVLGYDTSSEIGVIGMSKAVKDL